MDVVMMRGRVFRGFLSNLMAKLISTEDDRERDRVIHAWLDDPQTHRVTGDDKTLLVAIQRPYLKLAGAPVFTGEDAPKTAAPSSADEEKLRESDAQEVGAFEAVEPTLDRTNRAGGSIGMRRWLLPVLAGAVAAAVVIAAALAYLWRDALGSVTERPASDRPSIHTGSPSAIPEALPGRKESRPPAPEQQVPDQPRAPSAESGAMASDTPVIEGAEADESSARRAPGRASPSARHSH
jgi:hypothetical protein